MRQRIKLTAKQAQIVQWALHGQADWLEDEASETGEYAGPGVPPRLDGLVLVLPDDSYVAKDLVDRLTLLYPDMAQEAWEFGDISQQEAQGEIRAAENAADKIRDVLPQLKDTELRANPKLTEHERWQLDLLWHDEGAEVADIVPKDEADMLLTLAWHWGYLAGVAGDSRSAPKKHGSVQLERIASQLGVLREYRAEYRAGYDQGSGRENPNVYDMPFDGELAFHMATQAASDPEFYDDILESGALMSARKRGVGMWTYPLDLAVGDDRYVFFSVGSPYGSGEYYAFGFAFDLEELRAKPGARVGVIDLMVFYEDIFRRVLETQPFELGSLRDATMSDLLYTLGHEWELENWPPGLARAVKHAAQPVQNAARLKGKDADAWLDYLRGGPCPERIVNRLERAVTQAGGRWGLEASRLIPSRESARMAAELLVPNFVPLSEAVAFIEEGEMVEPHFGNPDMPSPEAFLQAAQDALHADWSGRGFVGRDELVQDVLARLGMAQCALAADTAERALNAMAGQANPWRRR